MCCAWDTYFLKIFRPSSVKHIKEKTYTQNTGANKPFLTQGLFKIAKSLALSHTQQHFRCSTISNLPASWQMLLLADMI